LCLVDELPGHHDFRFLGHCGEADIGEVV
jgi:hypothetical protein